MQFPPQNGEKQTFLCSMHRRNYKLSHRRELWSDSTMSAGNVRILVMSIYVCNGTLRAHSVCAWVAIRFG